MNPDSSGLIEITQRLTDLFYAKVMSGLSRPRFPAQSGRETAAGIEPQTRFVGRSPTELVTQLELLGDRGVTFHVRVVQVVQQATALTNHHEQTAA